MNISRRQLFSGLTASLAAVIVSTPANVFAQTAPSANQIEQSLGAAPKHILKPNQRVKRRDLRIRRDIRDIAPSIDIQAINFEFGSASISSQEFWKVENIAIAMRRIMRRNRGEVFLIEGHTDAVGSNYSNYRLSEARAASLKRLLVRRFDVDPYALETIGFGEDYLLVPTHYAEWRNRRVTLRRVTDVITR